MDNNDLDGGSGPSDTLNLVVVGDTGVGKTNLLLSYATDQFVMEHIPTVFDHYSLETEVRSQRIKIEIWD
jgi:Ras-related C3 botulinum toxin substrate 1